MLEQVVRPFARPDTLARRRIVSTNVKIDVPEAVVSWGQAGTINGAQQVEEVDPEGVSFTVLTCDDKYEETGRVEQTVRIENPDDSSQFLMEKRPTSIAFNKVSEWEQANYNKTTIWQTNVESSAFTTVNFNNKKCRATYDLRVDVPT